MRQCGIAGRRLKRISQYLHNRKARNQIKTSPKQKASLKTRCTPGRSAVTNTFSHLHQRHYWQAAEECAIYADDLAFWCSEEYVSTANYWLNLALQVVESWTRSWLVKSNEKKKKVTPYSHSLPTAQGQTLNHLSRTARWRLPNIPGINTWPP